MTIPAFMASEWSFLVSGGLEDVHLLSVPPPICLFLLFRLLTLLLSLFCSRIESLLSRRLGCYLRMCGLAQRLRSLKVREVLLAKLFTVVDGLLNLIDTLGHHAGSLSDICENGLDELRRLIEAFEPRLKICGRVLLDMLGHAVAAGHRSCSHLSNKLLDSIILRAEARRLQTVQSVLDRKSVV